MPLLRSGGVGCWGLPFLQICHPSGVNVCGGKISWIMVSFKQVFRGCLKRFNFTFFEHFVI